MTVGKLHPAGALLIAVSILSSLLLTRSASGVIYLLLFILVLSIGSGISLDVLGRGIRRVWFLLAVTFALHMVISPGNSVHFDNLPQVKVNPEAFQNALMFTGRLALITAVSVGLFALFTPGRLARETGRWFALLPVARKSAAQAELLISLALRFVPLMSQEYGRLQLALAARGGESRGRLAKLHNWRQIMYPLLINAFRRADHVALSLQARGYDPERVRTAYHDRRLTAREWIMAIGISGAAFAAPFLKI